MISATRDSLKSWRRVIQLTSAEMALCRLIISKDFNANFPPNTRDIEGMLKCFGEVNLTEDGDKFAQEGLDQFEKEANEFISNVLVIVRNLDITDKESFISIFKYCSYLTLAIDACLIFDLPEQIALNISDYIMAAFVKSRELRGYWTAKMEARGNNPGADAMKKRGEKNTKAIKDVLAELKIDNTGIFRHDKILREQFFSMAKQMADCTSEDRILKIARSLLG